MDVLLSSAVLFNVSADDDFSLLLLKGTDHGLVHVAVYPVVTVDETDVVAGSHGHSGIAGCSLAAVLLVDGLDATVFLSIRFADAAGGVLRTVVNEQQFPVRVALGEDGVNALREILLAVINGYDNTDGGLFHSYYKVRWSWERKLARERASSRNVRGNL